MSYVAELRLMFTLMDRVPDGITPMLHDLEEHIIHAGLADMHDAADTITTVRIASSSQHSFNYSHPNLSLSVPGLRKICRTTTHTI